MFAFSTLVVAASLAATVAADHGHGLHARSHHHVDRSNLQKRFSGTATYYAVGMGACGQNNVPSDFIVALNSAQFGGGSYPGPNCFKPITICAKGKCVGATIMDECPSCGYGSLDLSEGLFTQFANTGDGVFPMTWTFAGDEPAPAPAPTSTKKPDPTPTKQPEPEPTTTKKPEPTTTWEEPTTTSSKRKTTTWSPPPEPTSTQEPTTSSTHFTPTTTSSSTSTVVSTTSVSSTSVAVTTSATSTSSASSASSMSNASSASSTSAAPSASASSASTTGSGNNSPGSGSNLADAQQIMVALGRLVTAANDS
ncbi:unnamed protein product [Rhizoctonia solani]|uniref:Uncharacterized protein n=1 Tax=Rhizoctonia solani TaxID=456999 RepID=A0A8H2XFN9_9AGAM|nr:unnamed protein product [Rhizoctonia solani]